MRSTPRTVPAPASTVGFKSGKAYVIISAN
jgi:hypothetical protein